MFCRWRHLRRSTFSNGSLNCGHRVFPEPRADELLSRCLFHFQSGPTGVELRNGSLTSNTPAIARASVSAPATASFESPPGFATDKPLRRYNAWQP